MYSLLLIWVALFAALLIFAIGNRRDGALTLSYFLGLSLIHVPGALAYAFAPSFLNDQRETELGFEMTLAAMAAYVLGATLMRMLSSNEPRRPIQAVATDSVTLARISTRMTVAGLVAYFIALPLSRFIPSLTSLVYPLTALIIIGLWIQLYLGIVLKEHRRLFVTLLMLPLLPLLTTATGGFINYGAYWSLSIASFFFVMLSRPRRRLLLAFSPLFAYLALSLFVTYMRDRTEIRDVVWEENAGLEDRISRVGRTIDNFEFLDLSDPDQLNALDARLNQNFFVGLAIDRIEEGEFNFEYGGTVPIWAFIPRAVWPAKPDVGGGRAVVRDVTGLELDEQTSWGAGQVLEFYVNFGWPGAVIGFFGLGALFRRLDCGVAEALGKIDVRRLLLFAMPGFTMLQPGGNLLEMTVSTVAALTMAYVLGLKAAFWIPPPPERRILRV